MAATFVHVVLISFALGALVLKGALQTRGKLLIASDALIIERIEKRRVAFGAVSGIEAVNAVIDHVDTFIALFCIANESCSI